MNNFLQVLTDEELCYMLCTKLSSKGQIVIPKSIRMQYDLHAGQNMNVIDTEEGILLQPSNFFHTTNLEEVAGILEYKGKSVSLEEMQEAIKSGAIERKIR